MSYTYWIDRRGRYVIVHEPTMPVTGDCWSTETLDECRKALSHELMLRSMSLAYESEQALELDPIGPPPKTA